jgi:small neutral amino acid transporter SnatA (MarC family)
MAEVSFEIAGGVAVALDGLSEELRKTRQRAEKVAQLVHPVVVSGISLPLTAGAGTLNIPNMLGPMTGHYWDLKRITAYGFSAGTVTVTLGASQGDVLTVISTEGSVLFGKAHILLNGGDNLYFTAAGITGTVSVAIAAIEIAAPVIGDYLL